jgi:hypothetical protein
MFASTSSAPVAFATHVPLRKENEPLHLMLVQTPSLTERGRAWLERAQMGAFDGLELQRFIRLEKLSLG